MKPLFVICQNVEWSNQQKVKSKTAYSQVIGENATGMYLVKCKNGGFATGITIEKYRSNLALENSIELKQPLGSIIEKMLLLNDGMLVVASKRNDSLPKVDVLCWKIDAALKNGSIKTLTQIEAVLFRSNSSVYFQQSANKQNYTLSYFVNGNDKLNSTLHLHGFDDGLNETFHKTLTIAYAPNENVISGFEADDEGNIFMLIDFPKKDDGRKLKNLRDFYLYAYYKSLDKTLEYKLGYDSSFINDIGLAVNNYKKVITIIGTYAGENNNKVDGTFLYTIDAVSTVVSANLFEPLAKAFVLKISTTLLNETGNYLSDLYIRKIIPRSDGGCVLIMEKFYETRQTYTYYANGFPQTASRITYNYDEIIILSKDASGKTQHQEFIKKNQSSTNDAGYFSSFVLLNSTNKLSFIYSSDVGNEGDIMISSINPNGQLETKILVKSLSYYVMLMPSESKQVNANSTVICTMKDRRFTLMKLTN